MKPRRLLIWLVGCLLFGGLALNCLAADEADNAPRTDAADCLWTSEPITIDGADDENAWKHAPWIEDFGQPWLKARLSATTSTRARLLWGRDNLYVFAQLEDHDILAHVTEHDGRTWSDDVFELFFKPADDKPGYYEFQVNAAGTVLDMFLPRREPDGYERYRAEGNFHVESKVVLDGTLNQHDDEDRGWSVEIRIPWTDFMRTGGRPVPDEVWKFALCRYDYADNHKPVLSQNLARSSQPIPNFHRYEDYATLRFLGPAESGRRDPSANLPIDRFRPTVSRLIGTPDPPPPFVVRRAFPGLEFTSPMNVTRQPGTDRLIVIAADRPQGYTRLVRFPDSDDVSSFETILDLSEQAYGVAFHPDYAHNGYIYVGGNGPSDADPATKVTRVTRYTMDPAPDGQIDPESRLVIIEWPSDGHNGGDLAFGLDGMLYVTSGDGTGDSDTDLTGQGLDHLLAKVLRIDVDHPDGDQPYSVPADNPFRDLEGARPETWAYGLRNPWRITVDAGTGHVWVGNNGQDLWEQIYLVKKGDNFGWSVYEGSHPFYLNRQLGPTPHVKPTVEHPHSEARSLTGGVVYYGSRWPELAGAYIYGDYSTGKIWAVKHDGEHTLWHREIADTALQIAGFGADSQGELLVADYQAGGLGGLYALESNPQPEGNADFPRKLSETGLFQSVSGHMVEASLIPYSVNAPLWSDGADKARFLALPNADSKVDITPNRGWNFPDGTVAVKSFALRLRDDDPDSRRWIETRLLTRQQGEWVGYSYAWNDEQTEATLVETGGTDRTFTIETEDGTREQTWHYPSRTECMVCHTRAANFVLGLSTRQMNRQHDYGHATANQLHVLEQLGLLSNNWSGHALAEIRRQGEQQGISGEELDAYVTRQTTHTGQRQPQASPLLNESPESFPKLVDPYDATLPLADRARSYLHANCSVCHVPAGGGNSQIDLEFATALDKMLLIDVPPKHDSFGIEDARLVAPGDPSRSVLLHRLSVRGRGQMPQLGTSLVDQQAVELLTAWIEELQ